MNDVLNKKLNLEQIESVVSTEGYNRVIAGAGTGKTRVLIYRYAYLIAELGIDPSNILCITFTNKAASVMKKRAKELLGEKSLENGIICTFHSLALRILREDGVSIGWPENFQVIDTMDRKEIVQEIIEENELRKKEKYIRIDDAVKHIDYLKDTGKELIESLVHNKFNYTFKTIYDEIFCLFLKKQRARFLLDFEDLLRLVLYLFKNDEKVLKKWQDKFVYIMVDEYQDVDDDQDKFLHYLQGKHNNLMVVGDPDQSIYSFRGAKIERMVEFDKYYTSTKDTYITMNYRSTKNILNNANSLIKNNEIRLEKDLNSMIDDNFLPIHYYAKDEFEESKFVVDTIKKLIDDNLVSYKDIAILYRASHMSRSIEQGLIRENIKYNIYSGIRFYEREEVKDIISYLKLLEYEDDISLMRIINKPLRKIGPVKEKYIKNRSTELGISYYELIKREPLNEEIKNLTNIIEKYKTKKSEYNNLSDFVDEYINEIGYIKFRKDRLEDDRLENISEMMYSVRLYAEENMYENKSLNNYLQDIALYTSQDEITDKNVVSLMTIHASKGLEYKCVFCIGWNDSSLPNRKSMQELKEKGLEEERRLAYVAITRAIKYLYISNSIGGKNIYNVPSRFLLELDEESIKRIGCTKESLELEINSNKEYENIKIEGNDTIWNIGDIVEHKVFGIGIIKEINSSSIIVYFDKFPDTPKPILKTFSGIKKVEANKD